VRDPPFAPAAEADDPDLRAREALLDQDAAQDPTGSSGADVGDPRELATRGAHEVGRLAKVAEG